MYNKKTFIKKNVTFIHKNRSGTGTWVFDLASDFPKSRFTGIEIQSFMLPTIRPSNTLFIHDDVLEGIPFNPNSFDYIHMRFMLLCFTDLQYDKVIKNCVELLRPNGFLELCEPKLHFDNMGPATQRIVDECTYKSFFLKYRCFLI